MLMVCQGGALMQGKTPTQVGSIPTKFDCFHCAV